MGPQSAGVGLNQEATSRLFFCRLQDEISRSNLLPHLTLPSWLERCGGGGFRGMCVHLFRQDAAQSLWEKLITCGTGQKEKVGFKWCSEVFYNVLQRHVAAAEAAAYI